jgi:hypothetical protein
VLAGVNASALRAAARDVDVEGIPAFAERILPRASDPWVQASLDYKQRLQRLFFPEGIAFDGNRFNRTAVTAPPFKYLATGEKAMDGRRFSASRSSRPGTRCVLTAHNLRRSPSSWTDGVSWEATATAGWSPRKARRNESKAVNRRADRFATGLPEKLQDWCGGTMRTAGYVRHVFVIT